MGGILEYHRNLPIIALLFTLAWAFVIVAAPRRPIGLGSLGRLLYFGAIGSMGLVGGGASLLSLIYPRGFPWAGFLAIIHVFTGMRARRALCAGRRSQAIIAVALQLACAIASHGLQ
ncbi:hypothetical protein [Sphingobium aquiterrae]|uniref:hypothetical protein n=1 Tax=Sphingobium aquiterrae TaxID=2038656 RepID=UPI00301AD0FA|tara:strand:- start:2138 stop:2488 length:351 start_codon:yes stop_codon:yes gene_type:complete